MNLHYYAYNNHIDQNEQTVIFINDALLKINLYTSPMSRFRLYVMMFFQYMMYAVWWVPLAAYLTNLEVPGTSKSIDPELNGNRLYGFPSDRNDCRPVFCGSEGTDCA